MSDYFDGEDWWVIYPAPTLRTGEAAPMQQSNTEKRGGKNGDEYDAYSHRYRYYIARLNPRKSFKDVKRRTHKRERQDYKRLIEAEL